MFAKNLSKYIINITFKRKTKKYLKFAKNNIKHKPRYISVKELPNLRNKVYKKIG